MPRTALQQDWVYEGVIYLKGETEYPADLEKAIGDKGKQIEESNKRISPIFNQQPLPAPNSTQSATQADVEMALNAKKAADEIAAAEGATPTGPVPPVPGAPVDDSAELPNDFPHRELFVAAGYATIESVRELPQLTEVDGIGDGRATDVQNWLDANQPQ